MRTFDRRLAASLLLVGGMVLFSGCGDDTAYLDDIATNGGSSTYSATSGRSVLDDPIMAGADELESSLSVDGSTVFGDAASDFNEDAGSLETVGLDSDVDDLGWEDDLMPASYGRGEGGWGDGIYGYGNGILGSSLDGGGWGGSGLLAAGYEPGLGGAGLMDAGFEDPGLLDAGLEDPGLVDPGFEDPGFVDPGFDAGIAGAGFEDPGFVDAGFDPGFADADVVDAGFDPGFADAGIVDAGFDPGIPDVGTVDAGMVDTGIVF